MVVDTKKENLNINKLVCEKKEMLEVDGDMIVPDSKPDILNTINTSGNICVYKKELMELFLSGVSDVDKFDFLSEFAILQIFFL